MKVLLNIISSFMILIALVIVMSCNDEDEIPEDSMLDEYISLKAREDTLYPGDSTRVTASATGNKLTYTWRTNNNAPIIHIEGINNQVYFYADPCVGLGDSYIYCKIQANNRTEEKKEVITIIQRP